MSHEPSEFKPLPRRSGSGKRRPKRTVVGASIPSTARRTSRPRTLTPSDTGNVPARPRRRRRAKKTNAFGWLKYAALLLAVGIGGFFVANLVKSPPDREPSSAVAAGHITPSADSTPDPNVAATPQGSFFPIFNFSDPPTAEPTVVPTPAMPEVAIVAGHWAKESDDGVPAIRDSGATCPDGLREVDITKSVADKTLALMQQRGYHTVLLQEFDPVYKTDHPDFAPRVFLSIHADSCLTGADYEFATGYKIAHAEPSDNQEQDDRLVTCLTRSYDRVAAKYDKPFNVNTITPAMTEYHAFRKIDPHTPAAIIELGFLGYDRDFLTNHQEEMAQGLAGGLDDFLHDQSCVPPTATPKPTKVPRATPP